MAFFRFGKRSETLLTVVTLEGPGRLRLNGLRAKDDAAKKAAVGHDRTVCWVEYAADGTPKDRGPGKAARQVDGADRLLRDLPANPTCRAILDRLLDGQDSVGKWLQLGEPAAR